ncbi:SET domain-containing protein [Mycena kentingensis (nom. inval.)]|nr:SET domain-containing protein [Mycena kentingensis (nom. inval.)]
MLKYTLGLSRRSLAVSALANRPSGAPYPLNALTDAIPIEERVEKYGYAPDPHGPVYCTIPATPGPGEHSSQCFLDPKVLKKLNNRPGFPRPPKPPRETPFRLRDCGAKGVGVFATRPIEQGELLVDERPLLVTHIDTPVIVPREAGIETQVEMKYRAKIDGVGLMVARMPLDRRKAFMALRNSSDEENPLLGILDTNSADISLDGVDGAYAMTCDRFSRINHSCSPNCAAGFVEQSWSSRVTAVRDIAQDEELTITYVNPASSVAARQKRIAGWQFICTCPACSDPASDARRASIVRVDKQRMKLAMTFRNRATQRTKLAPELLKVAQRELGLIETEGMEAFPGYWMAMFDLVLAFYEMGDVEAAMEMAGRVARCSWMDEHDGGDVRRKMAAVARGEATQMLS